MYPWPKYNTYNCKILELKTQGRKFQDTGFGDRFLDMTPKAHVTKKLKKTLEFKLYFMSDRGQYPQSKKALKSGRQSYLYSSENPKKVKSLHKMLQYLNVTYTHSTCPYFKSTPVQFCLFQMK